MEAFFIAMFLYHFTPYWNDSSATVTPPTRRPAVLTIEVQGETSGRSVPAGAQRVEMLTLKLDATCTSDIPLESIMLQRRGMGDKDDIAAVYALRRGVRISNAPSISRRDGTVQLRLRNMRLEACTSEEISIFADFSADASVAGEHYFVLKGTSGVQAGGASVRIRRGTNMSTVIRGSPQTTRTAGGAIGTISVEYLRLFRRPTYGSRQMVARLRLDADGGDDHHIHAITLTNEGSARDTNLRNLYLVVGGTVSQRVAFMDGDRVRLIFDPPLLMNKNQEKIGVLRADVRASRSRTIKFIVEEPSDVESEVIRGRR